MLRRYSANLAQKEGEGQAQHMSSWLPLISGTKFAKSCRILCHSLSRIDAVITLGITGLAHASAVM